VKAVVTKKLSTALALEPSSSIYHFKETRKKEDNRNLIKEFLINYRLVEKVPEILIETN
jgi:sporulation protein YlmC with PRC-barrel domain